MAEYSFSLFAERAKELQCGITLSASEKEDAAWSETEKQLAPFFGPKISKDFTVEQRVEIRELSGRLCREFLGPRMKSVIRPVFLGCGYIETSEADLICNGTFYEIKTVNRHFRGVDVRQVITYCALNFASKQFFIQNIGLFNPRSGLICDINMDEVCRGIAGVTSDELFATIIETVSSGETSR